MIRIARRPRPSLRALRRAATAFRQAGRGRCADPNDLSRRDSVFIDAVLPLFDFVYDHYFRCETELECEIPDGPVLAVANHNGMTGTPDMFCHMTAYWRRYGTERLAYGLMHDVPFQIPFAGRCLNRFGAIAANPQNGAAALAQGAHVLVFPGGDLDACRPYRCRYQIKLGGRLGFVRLAIRSGVPILPIVSVGGHSSLYLLSDGRRIARALHLPQSRLRSNVFPIGFALPFGIIFGNPMPHFPPPVKIHTRFLTPVEHALPPEAADDEAIVKQLYLRVVAAMQSGMDDLRRAGRHGLFPAAE